MSHVSYLDDDEQAVQEAHRVAAEATYAAELEQFPQVWKLEASSAAVHCQDCFAAVVVAEDLMAACDLELFLEISVLRNAWVFRFRFELLREIQIFRFLEVSRSALERQAILEKSNLTQIYLMFNQSFKISKGFSYFFVISKSIKKIKGMLGL